MQIWIKEVNEFNFENKHLESFCTFEFQPNAAATKSYIPIGIEFSIIIVPEDNDQVYLAIYLKRTINTYLLLSEKLTRH